jgi:hypothetical protein
MKSLIPLLLTLFITGCSITQEIYLQRVDVTSPIFEPPLLVSDSMQLGDVVISPHLSVSQNRSFTGTAGKHTKVNQNGAYQLDTTRNGYEVSLRETPGANIYEYRGNTMFWTAPDINGGLQLELAIGRSASLTAGVTYSGIANESFWGGNVGIGLRKAGETMALRIDGGLHWTPTRYDGETVVVTRVTVFNSTTEDVYTYHDIGSETNVGLYGSLMINSRRSDWLLNVFLQFGFVRQRLTNYEPSTTTFPTPYFFSYTVNDLRNSSYVTMLSLTPGISVNLGDGQRVLIGARWNRGVVGADQGNISGVVKLDLLF